LLDQYQKINSYHITGRIDKFAPKVNHDSYHYNFYHVIKRWQEKEDYDNCDQEKEEEGFYHSSKSICDN
jgi:hypothetical protein